MNQEILITPEELYYLGEQMEAKYVDYAYVAAMGDIQINPGMYQSKVKTGLSGKGFLEEDFSGNTELSPGVKEMLSPVFFGEFESSIDICTVGEELAAQNIKFHFQGDKVVKTVRENLNWKISLCDADDVLTELKHSVPKPDPGQENGVFNPDKVSCILVFKHVRVGEESMVRLCFCCEGRLYMENEKEEIVPVEWEQVLAEAGEVLLLKKE